ncbi:MAG: potassium-transporting ATPase subunit F [Proteobacteria bacterium]|nr:potassium-transporting ATPase subunit F [Pseudomonadota bacterium]
MHTLTAITSLLLLIYLIITIIYPEKFL